MTSTGAVNSVIFVALSVLALRQWQRRREPAAGRLAAAFLTLGLIVSAGRFVSAHPHGLLADIPQRLEIELLVLFPYLLYRFAAVFNAPPPAVRRAVASLTLVLSVWTFALPRVPTAGEPRPWWFLAYVIVFLVHWTALSVLVAVRLWRAGRGQPGVSSKRMRLLGLASALLTLAIIATAFAGGSHTAGALVGGALGTVSGLAFIVGLAPPRLLRSAWRGGEQQRLQEAIRGLMTLATTPAEVAERVLAPAAALVGARASAISDGDGRLLASRGDTAAGQPVVVEAPGAKLAVWTSPYAPFFGDDELRVLDTVAALTGIAIDRVRLFEQEHQSRLALERANETMANFVALAAHELRTPVTTIHGFVHTLNHLDARLDDAEKDELRDALAQQTARMASLVEQLLDLSRLDADAVEVRPQPIDIRSRLEDVVAVAAAARVDEVLLDVPESVEATIDPAILDHIVTNLVTNAFRYGRPPVRVIARKLDDVVQILVEDAGPGVAVELEETLFERFTRAGLSRDRVAGTGLGLAIARAYARAHRGDVRYEAAEPSGARFVVDLPSA